MAKYTGMARGLRNAWQMREAEEAQDTMRDRDRVINSQWQQENDRRKALDLENRRQFETIRQDRRKAFDMERAAMEQKAADERDSKWAESLHSRNEGFSDLISAPTKEEGIAKFNAKGQLKITDYEFDPTTGDLSVFLINKPEPVRISANVVSKLRNLGRATEERGLKMESEKADIAKKNAEAQKALREPEVKPDMTEYQKQNLLARFRSTRAALSIKLQEIPEDQPDYKTIKDQIDDIDRDIQNLRGGGQPAPIPQSAAPQGQPQSGTANQRGKPGSRWLDKK